MSLTFNHFIILRIVSHVRTRHRESLHSTCSETSNRTIVPSAHPFFEAGITQISGTIQLGTLIVTELLGLPAESINVTATGVALKNFVTSKGRVS